MTASEDDARAFARRYVAFLEWVHQAADPGVGRRVTELLVGHLGEERRHASVVARDLPPYEQVNVQTALDAWTTSPGRTVAVHGLALPPHYGGVTLSQLLSGEGLPPLRLSAPDLVDLPNGPGSTLACLRTGLLLVTDSRGPYVLMVRGPEPHQQPTLTLEVVGLSVAAAQAVQQELVELATALNVYRGHVLELVADNQGGLSIAFVSLPETRREDVVLPEAVLRRVERHTVDMAGLRDRMRAAGQHLKRGLLLYGPPGTGKTHTVRYVVGRLTGYTVLLLSGRSLHLIGSVAPLARTLQPAAVVLEDVDLVAEDRGYGPGPSPVLFELLDVMDGAAADADLVFLLTTNRADLLEPALAARPGRVDVAVEIGLPDADARRRLFAVYGARVPMRVSDADVDRVVERTGGMTASFVKELLRRAVLESLTRTDGEPGAAVVHGADLDAALDDMLDATQEVTRALLSGRPGGDRTAQGHGGFGPVPGLAPPAWSG
ncbi:AAA family ATPase [Nakamurella deserti]|uniref:AAA family ATPase n=1 Tax=Nakamurella deserti TaxID=2164074 RepID=UPI000DBE1C04|nr:ATP-binding protein [Nakamurella deserti]